jgi:hypothetical protein
VRAVTGGRSLLRTISSGSCDLIWSIARSKQLSLGLFRLLRLHGVQLHRQAAGWTLDSPSSTVEVTLLYRSRIGEL